MQTALFNFDMMDDVIVSKQKILFVSNQVSWMIFSETSEILQIDMRQPGLKSFKYGNSEYTWLCMCDLFTNENECVITISISDISDNDILFKFVITITPSTIKYESLPYENDLYNSSLITKYITTLSEICDEYKKYLKKTTPKNMKNINHYLLLKACFHVSKEYVSDSIKLDDFLKLDCDDINYNKTIYRISNDEMIPKIEDVLKHGWEFGKQYRFETVRVNKLFYIENCDIQDISDYDGDRLFDRIEEGYKIIEII